MAEAAVRMYRSPAVKINVLENLSELIARTRGLLTRAPSAAPLACVTVEGIIAKAHEEYWDIEGAFFSQAGGRGHSAGAIIYSQLGSPPRKQF